MSDNEKIYLTLKGAGTLQKELFELRNKERAKVVKIVSWAASNGDRSENGDYIYGKRRLREIDRRIRFLIKRLETAEVIDPSKTKSDRVLFGATIHIENESGTKKIFQIVGADETNASEGKISWKSPMAKALLQKKSGTTVTVKTPRGDEDVEIIEIHYL